MPIESFDQIMFMISRKLEIENPEKEMRAVTEKRIEAYNLQYDEFEASMREKSQESDSTDNIIKETVSQMDSLNQELLKEAEKEETAEAYFQKGRIYYRTKNYEDGITAYTKTIELNSEYVAAYNNRGLIYYDLGDYEKALKDYKKALELKPDYAIAYFNRGLVYSVSEENEKALQDFTEAIRLDSAYVKAYRLRAKTYRKLNRIEEAEEDERKLKELNEK